MSIYGRTTKTKAVIAMKKIFLILALMAGMSATGNAAIDWVGSMRPTLWRSSITCAPTNFVSIATMSVHLHSVTISSPSINQLSFVAFYNSTGTAVGGYNTNIATAAIAYTNSTILTPISPGTEILFDRTLSSGAVVNKPVDGVCIDTKWDYSTPRGITNSPVSYFP